MKEIGKMIERTLKKEILKNLSIYPVILITGARQVGKSSLCKMLMEKQSFLMSHWMI